MEITILGIESSCDDTSAAVIRNTTLLSNVIASQAVHVKYGGVIPELASRAHQQNIIPVVDTALKEAGVKADKIDAIAFTRGPGLLGSLMVGTSFAKGLAIANNRLGIHGNIAAFGGTCTVTHNHYGTGTTSQQRHDQHNCNHQQKVLFHK